MKLRKTASALLLGLGVMGASGVMHFVAPKSYETIIPESLGNPRFWVYASGFAELVVAGLLCLPRTRRLGSWLCILLLIAVFPANVYAALQGGYKTFSPPFDSRFVAIARLPLQVLLIWWAWRVGRQKVTA